MSRSSLAKRAFDSVFEIASCRPETHWARHTLFDFDIAAEVDAFACGVRRAFEWVGGFRPTAEAHAIGESKEATCANQAKRREQQFETRAQETLLIDILQRRESQIVGEVCHLSRRAKDALA